MDGQKDIWRAHLYLLTGVTWTSSGGYHEQLGGFSIYIYI